MKNTAKILVVAMFAIVLFSGLASAMTFTAFPTELAQDSSSFTFTLNNSESQTGTISISDIVQGTQKIQFAITSGNTLLDGSNTYTVTYSTTGFDFKFPEDYSTTINVLGSTNNITKTFSFKETSFCGNKAEKDASIDLKIDDVNVVSGFGDDDDYWYLRDTVEIDVLFEDPNYDIEDIDIEWELWSNGKMIDDGEESMSDVDENDDETITLTIKLDENIDDFDDSAVFYVRAIGKINDKDNAVDGKKVCEYDSKKVDISIDKDFVVVDSLKINDQSFDYKYEVTCKQEVTISGEITNIGSKDQDDLYIELYSSALGVNKKIEFDNIDSFDSEKFSYTFKVPENMDVSTAKMSIEVFDEDNDLFENDEDDKSTQNIQFALTGNCKVVKPTVTVKALEVTPKSGEDMTVTATITNMNEGSVIYTLAAEGFQEWATLNEVTPEVVQLTKGQSKDVTFKFTTKKGMEGEKFFNIETIEGGKAILSQPVSVTVEKATLDIGNLFGKGNLQIAGIVALNLILLIAIILVARKILRKK